MSKIVMLRVRKRNHPNAKNKFYYTFTRVGGWVELNQREIRELTNVNFSWHPKLNTFDKMKATERFNRIVGTGSTEYRRQQDKL